MPSHDTKIFKGKCAKWFSSFVNIQQSHIWLICFLNLSNAFDLMDCVGPLLWYRLSFWQVMYLPAWDDGSFSFCISLFMWCVCVLHIHESMSVPPLHVHVVARTGHGVFSSMTDLVSALIQSLLMNQKLVISARPVGRQALRICPCFSIQSYRSRHLCLYVSTGDSNPRFPCFQREPSFPLNHLPRSGWLILVANMTELRII